MRRRTIIIIIIVLTTGRHPQAIVASRFFFSPMRLTANTILPRDHHRHHHHPYGPHDVLFGRIIIYIIVRHYRNRLRRRALWSKPDLRLSRVARCCSGAQPRVINTSAHISLQYTYSSCCYTLYLYAYRIIIAVVVVYTDFVLLFIFPLPRAFIKSLWEDHTPTRQTCARARARAMVRKNARQPLWVF